MASLPTTIGRMEKRTSGGVPAASHQHTDYHQSRGQALRRRGGGRSSAFSWCVHDCMFNKLCASCLYACHMVC